MGRVSLLIAGSLLLLFSLPLAGRKVPMNKYYGFRSAAAFKSSEHWYEINAYGGRWLAACGLLILAAGAAGFLLPEKYRSAYERWTPLVVVAAVLVAFVRVGIWSRRYGQ